MRFTLNLGQNKALYAMYLKLKNDTSYYKQLNSYQQRVIDEGIKDFQLEGVDLEGINKKKYRRYKTDLSRMQLQFSTHVLDDTNDYCLVITDKNQLKGLPESVLKQAQNEAIKRKHAKEGEEKNTWTFTLQMPSYTPFMQYCANSSLREQMYKAYFTRATQGKRNNSPLIEKILATRKKLAALFGYQHYGELSLVKKMANSAQEVEDFLWDLKHKTQTMAEKEKKELIQFKAKSLKQKKNQETSLAPWDVPYYGELLRKQKFDYDAEQLKEYFPLPKVLEGLFYVVETLFGYRFQEVEAKHTWDEEVLLYALLDKDDQVKSYVYMDLYARQNKQSGAWMSEHHTQYRTLEGKMVLPIAYIVGNFTPPQSKKSVPTLRHQEVITLFHEMGHALHHMLTKIEYLSISGIRGVPWDGVELPSQFLEYWAWHEKSIQRMSSHIQTKKPIDKALLNKLIDSKNFQAGLMMLRQLEFSLMDMGLHVRYRSGESMEEFIHSLRKEVSIFEVPTYNRYQNAFLHIFANDGYAAGYYVYKWAEVLAADAFSLFEEQGIFNAKAGAQFLTHILAQGGGDDFMRMYTRFRGRKPNNQALLRHCGLLTTVGNSGKKN